MVVESISALHYEHHFHYVYYEKLRPASQPSPAHGWWLLQTVCVACALCLCLCLVLVGVLAERFQVNAINKISTAPPGLFSRMKSDSKPCLHKKLPVYLRPGLPFVCLPRTPGLCRSALPQSLTRFYGYRPGCFLLAKVKKESQGDGKLVGGAQPEGLVG